jgi:hypothetical protein
MIINTEHKILYISNAKCASSTIRKHFYKIKDKELVDSIQKQNRNNPHVTYKDVSKYVLTEHNIDISTFFLFSTIRNPWERIVSLYHYAKPDKNGMAFWDYKYGGKREEGTSCTFTEWLFKLDKANRNNLFKYACRNIEEMFGEDYSKFKLYKTEELDVNKIMDDINDSILETKVGRAEFKIIDPDGWKEKEKVESKNYREYYNKETRDMIADYYKLDIKVGKYKF